MPNNQFDINVNNGVAVVVDNDVHPVNGWRYTPNLLTNHNHCYMPKLNACFILDNDTSNSINILKVAIPLKRVIILAPLANVRISLMLCVLAMEIKLDLY